MARCRRLVASQAAFARVFSMHLWTMGRVAAFMDSDGVPAVEADLRRRLRRGGWPVILHMVPTAGGLCRTPYSLVGRRRR